MVEPVFKQTGFRQRSRQRDNRLLFERAFQAGKRIVRERSKGWCEVDGCDRPATQTHHKAGRRGPIDLVNDPRMLLDVCAPCDHRITTEPEWAKAEGYSLDRVSLPSPKIVASVAARTQNTDPKDDQ